jgi:hypothetical protein
MAPRAGARLRSASRGRHEGVLDRAPATGAAPPERAPQRGELAPRGEQQQLLRAAVRTCERDAACPISTGRGTQRVHLVRGEGRGVSGQYEWGGGVRTATHYRRARDKRAPAASLLPRLRPWSH